MRTPRAVAGLTEPNEPGRTDSSHVSEAADEELPAPIGMVDARVDLVIAAGTAVLGALLIAASTGIRQGSIPDPIGAGGFARLLGAFLAVLGILLCARRAVALVRSPRAERQVYADGGPADEPGFPASTLRPFVILGLGLAWALMLPLLGYVVPTALVTAAALVAMRLRSIPSLVAISVLFSLLTWILFARVAGLRFPAGPVDLFLEGIVPRFG